MIKANELRVGNKVLFENNIYTCAQIGSVVRFEETGLAYANDWLEPISLIPEILEAAGFGFTDMADLGTSYDIAVLEDMILTFDIDKNEFWIGQNKLDVKYLHQLQNLYFALTGQELTINLHATA